MFCQEIYTFCILSTCRFTWVLSVLTASAVLPGCLGMAFLLQGSPLSMYVPSLFLKHSLDILHKYDTAYIQ